MRSTAHARCRLPAGLVLGFLLLGCCFNARAMPADFVGLQVGDYRLNLLIVPPATVDKYKVPLIAYVQFVFPIQ